MAAIAEERSGGPEAGTTALLVAVPEAEPAVGDWRMRFDRAAAAGVPAHVTVLYPFLHSERLDDRLLATLGGLFAAHAAFEMRFERTGRFPGLVYLAPSPADPFVALTTEVFERWPEAPPYAGEHPEIVPHLTVAHSEDPDVLAAVETALVPQLPIVAPVRSVRLFEYDGARWHPRAEFPLG